MRTTWCIWARPATGGREAACVVWHCTMETQADTTTLCFLEKFDYSWWLLGPSFNVYRRNTLSFTSQLSQKKAQETAYFSPPNVYLVPQSFSLCIVWGHHRPPSDVSLQGLATPDHSQETSLTSVNIGPADITKKIKERKWNTKTESGENQTSPSLFYWWHLSFVGR